MSFKFRENSKFALLAINGIHTDLPGSEFRLSDGTWVMPRWPVPNLGIWKEWIGSIRTEQLNRANLVLFREEESLTPQIVDDVHHQLGEDLGRLFYFLHLRQGVECAEANNTNLICGSCEQGKPGIRRMSVMPTFYPSKGYRLAPVTSEWLEETITLRSGAEAMKSSRVIRGLNVLFNGLQETAQDRVHQFVRSLEALILPDTGKTKKQFVNRCQTFVQPGDDAQLILREAFDMRSDTEHLQDWERAVRSYPPLEREDVCWQRTRQMEQLSCFAYSWILQNASLWEHFRTDAAIANFWKLGDEKRRSLWGRALDITAEPRYSKYHAFLGRAIT